MKLGRTSLIHFNTQVITSAAGFLTTFVIARLLGADVLGTFSVATSVMVLITIPTNTIGGAMNKRISEQQEPSSYFSAGMIIIVAFAIVLTAGLVGFGSILNEYLGASIVDLFILMVIGSAFYNLYTTILNGENKVIESGVVNTLEQVFQFLFQAGLIVLGYELAGLFAGKILSLLVAVIIAILISDLTFVTPKRHHFERIYEFAKYTWADQVKGRSFAWIDVFILGIFVESTLIGIYQVSWTFASTLILVSLSIQNTLLPEMSYLGVEKDWEEVHHLLTEALVFVGVFAIPGLFGAAIIGADLLTIYRPVFAQGYEVLLLLIVARAVDAYARQLLNTLAAIDFPKYRFRANIVFVVVNTALNLVLIWKFGWLGAAIATAFSAGIELILGYYYVTEVLGKPDIPYDQILRQFLAAGGMAVVIYLLTQVIPVTNYTVIGLVLVGAAVYTVLLLTISKLVRQKFRMLVPDTIPR
jgi:O-antigen/teichoic acid export membrane protein